jgi:hypothetical protein
MREFGDRKQRRIFQPKKKKVIGLLQKKSIMRYFIILYFTKYWDSEIKGGREMDCTCFMLRKN